MIERITALFHSLTKKDEKGASAVEYGLLIAGIAAVIVTAVMLLGPVVEEQFADTCAAITSGNSTTSASCNP